MKRQKNCQIYLRSIILWIIMVAYSPIIFIIAVCVIPLPVKLRHKILISWTALFNFCARKICKLNYKVIGAEYIPDTPIIIASNHQSVWETFCFNQIFPQNVWILKSSLLRIPFFGWALYLCLPIAINRSSRISSMKQIITQGRLRFKQGFCILSFPEGTRALPGMPLRHKRGTAKLAIDLNTSILPVAINSGVYYPKGSIWVYPGTITVKICPIITPQDNNVDILMQRLESVINQELLSINS